MFCNYSSPEDCLLNDCVLLELQNEYFQMSVQIL